MDALQKNLAYLMAKHGAKAANLSRTVKRPFASTSL